MQQINFFSTENMSLFWDYVKSLLSTAAPGVMIWFALIAVGMLLGIIVKAWSSSSKEQDDDDDIDIRHY